MKKRVIFISVFFLALLLPAALIFVAKSASDIVIPSRPEGPCDIYAEGDCPCVAAHSSTRALYASYSGPLYQVMRMSDGKTLDIGVVEPSVGDPGGYANAEAQDEFCKDTYCWVTVLYDQSGKGNHLVQAPRGAFSGPAMGGFDNLPIADMAPVSLMGHKVYGIFIAPDMGLRWNDTKGIAVDDQAEGQYWVINGLHYNDGCCFDYGNAETDSRDDGDGTMETTYYGNSALWYYGQDAGPWIMTDQENNLVGCVNPSPNDKYCADLPSITWRFVTATADGEPHRWRTMGGNAQEGDLVMMFDGPRIKNDRNSYDPMRKQGAIVLGNGGDNNNYSQGTYYEGAMTAPGTFPSEETNKKIQANIVAAKYDIAKVSIAPSSSLDKPQGLQTFSPQSSQNTTVSFTNTTGQVVNDLKLGVTVPSGWKSVLMGSDKNLKTFAKSIQPGETVSATFRITSGSKIYNGDIRGVASWLDTKTNKNREEIAIEKVRNVNSVKINEFRIGTGDNLTNNFIELYNAGETDVDISGWSLTQHANQLPIFSTIKVPGGTKLGAHEFYLLGLSSSGLSVPAKKGESTIYLRSIKGMSVGDKIEIGTGSNKEIRRIASISESQKPVEAAQPRQAFGRRPSSEPGKPTTIWQPLPDGPVITIKKGSNNIPVENTDNFKVGQKIAIGYGSTYPVVSMSVEKYEVLTVTSVGKPGTQAWLSMDAKAGETNIKVSSVENISAGDKIRLDIDSKGYGIEWVTVKSVGTASSRNTFAGPLTSNDNPGTGLDLLEPLKYNHASNMPFSVRGTGISFEPATNFDHSSNEPVLALGIYVVLDKPLEKNHDIDDVVRDDKVLTAGYQGNSKPDQWFGGPALSVFSGSMVLRDSKGFVIDGLNYGELVDPWLSEGYQAVSGAGQFGCFAVSPGVSGGSSRVFSQPGSISDRSAGRFPDGFDKDVNCEDFKIQKTTTLSMAVQPGSNNVKVSNVSGFDLGQRVTIGFGNNTETVIIATIGSSGAAHISADTEVGATVIPVDNTEGFNVGQKVVIGNKNNSETAVIASVSNRRSRFMGNNQGQGSSVTITKALSKKHIKEEQISGTGISFSTPLKNAHEKGSNIASNIPTPGRPNQY